MRAQSDRAVSSGGPAGGCGGAAADTPSFELREFCLDASRLQPHPEDEAERHHADAHVGDDDEGEVLLVAGHAPPRAAAWRLSVSARRRRISVRIELRCSSTNSRVKATIMTNSGVRMDAGILGPVGVMMLAGWCSVFHQSTENLI